MKETKSTKRKDTRSNRTASDGGFRTASLTGTNTAEEIRVLIEQCRKTRTLLKFDS
jgi:hypothetical protein